MCKYPLVHNSKSWEKKLDCSPHCPETANSKVLFLQFGKKKKMGGKKPRQKSDLSFSGIFGVDQRVYAGLEQF